MKPELLVLKLFKERDEALAAVTARFEKRLKKAYSRVVVCTHPQEAQESFTWEWDSGYGVQRSRDGILCRVCRREKHWPGATPWTRPGDRSTD